jgi:hypothetical protein
MFSKLLGKPSIEAEQKRAKLLFEKIKNTKEQDSLVRKTKIRAALMARNHVDLTFVDGSKQTELYQAKAMLAATSKGEKPSDPKVNEYQKIKTGNSEIWVYLPEELIDEVFRAGSHYQRMELSAADAIAVVQNVLDRLVQNIFGLDYEIKALGFLREESGLSDA